MQRMSAAPSSRVFVAVADPTRRALLELLLRSELTVGELARPFRMSRPAISQHLRVLGDAGLVRARRAGRKRVYRVDPEPLREVHDWVARFREVEDPAGHVWRLREPG